MFRLRSYLAGFLVICYGRHHGSEPPELLKTDILPVLSHNVPGPSLAGADVHRESRAPCLLLSVSVSRVSVLSAAGDEGGVLGGVRPHRVEDVPLVEVAARLKTVSVGHAVVAKREFHGRLGERRDKKETTLLN